MTEDEDMIQNGDNRPPAELDFWDALAVLSAFEQFRRKRPDDESAWNDVKSLISGEALVLGNRASALQWAEYAEEQGKLLEAHFQDIEQARILRPLRDDE